MQNSVLLCQKNIYLIIAIAVKMTCHHVLQHGRAWSILDASKSKETIIHALRILRTHILHNIANFPLLIDPQFFPQDLGRFQIPAELKLTTFCV